MYLLFDIGGTNIRVAVSSDGKTLSDVKSNLTPQNFNQGIQILKQIADELRGGQKIEAAAGGLPGPLDSNKTMTTNSANLPDWNNKPLKEILQKEFNAPVFLENDAALAGLGEAIDGAGQGHKIVAFVTISTGVGGARIVDGKIDRNVSGFEPGYQIINSGKTLSDFISGKALAMLYQKNPQEITDSKIWDEVSRYLAIGLNNTIVHWSPDIVVLGGSVVNKIPLEKVQTYINDYLTIFPIKPALVKAQLGYPGLYGALQLIKSHVHES